jgi:hypothetical protein
MRAINCSANGRNKGPTSTRSYVSVNVVAAKRCASDMSALLDDSGLVSAPATRGSVATLVVRGRLTAPGCADTVQLVSLLRGVRPAFKNLGRGVF